MPLSPAAEIAYCQLELKFASDDAIWAQRYAPELFTNRVVVLRRARHLLAQAEALAGLHGVYQPANTNHPH
jgi:hypothetical protein